MRLRVQELGRVEGPGTGRGRGRYRTAERGKVRLVQKLGRRRGEADEGWEGGGAGTEVRTAREAIESESGVGRVGGEAGDANTGVGKSRWRGWYRNWAEG